MGTRDKIENKLDGLVGEAKEVTGQATDDQNLVDEGKAQQIGADLAQAGEKVKDAVTDVLGKAKHTLKGEG